MNEGRRAELGIDGNCGFALLGENIQEGESEFVEILSVDKWPVDWTLSIAERVAAKTAFKRLKDRLNLDYNLSFYFGPSHPFGS